MSREILNTRTWPGTMLGPRDDFRPVAWGAGFHVAERVPDAFGLVIHPAQAGPIVRLRMSKLADTLADLAGPFRALNEASLIASVDHPLASLLDGASPELQAMIWFPLPEGAIAGPGCYAIEVSMRDMDGTAIPFSVGVLRTAAEWDWTLGFMIMEDGTQRPAKLPWSLVWGVACGRGAANVPALPRIEAEAQIAGPFELALSNIVLRDLGGPRRPLPRTIHVPGPQSEFVSVDLDQRVHKMALPYRWYQPARDEGAPPVGRRIEIIASKARCDLISLDRITGELRLTLGEERFLDPEEHPAILPPGHAALYSLLTTIRGIEPVRLFDFRDMVREGTETQHLRWLEWCRQRLPATMRKLRSGMPIRLAGYGDSVTALGGRAADHAHRPNGPQRDMLAYLECYGNDFKDAVPLYAPDSGGPAIHHRIGWNWQLKAAIEKRSDCIVAYDNWGIAGTTSGADVKDIDGTSYPNAANRQRLEIMLASRPDLVTIAVGMNDIGEPIDTYANVMAIAESVRKAGAEPIIIAPCRPNPAFNSRDDALWKLTHDRIMAAALDSDAAYLSTWDLYGDGNEGAIGVPRSSHCAASLGNHPGPRELAAIGRVLSKIVP
jgi:lysophospholipase L1-like esterase